MKKKYLLGLISIFLGACINNSIDFMKNPTTSTRINLNDFSGSLVFATFTVKNNLMQLDSLYDEDYMINNKASEGIKVISRQRNKGSADCIIIWNEPNIENRYSSCLAHKNIHYRVTSDYLKSYSYLFENYKKNNENAKIIGTFLENKLVKDIEQALQSKAVTLESIKLATNQKIKLHLKSQLLSIKNLKQRQSLYEMLITQLKAEGYSVTKAKEYLDHRLFKIMVEHISDVKPFMDFMHSCDINYQIDKSLLQKISGLGENVTLDNILTSPEVLYYIKPKKITHIEFYWDKETYGLKLGFTDPLCEKMVCVGYALKTKATADCRYIGSDSRVVDLGFIESLFHSTAKNKTIQYGKYVCKIADNVKQKMQNTLSQMKTDPNIDANHDINKVSNWLNNNSTYTFYLKQGQTFNHPTGGNGGIKNIYSYTNNGKVYWAVECRKQGTGVVTYISSYTLCATGGYKGQKCKADWLINDAANYICN